VTSYSLVTFASGSETISYQGGTTVNTFTYTLKASSTYNTPTIAISTSNPIVGATDGDIIITIPSPGADFTSYGGNLIITVPKWFGSTSNEYVF